MICEAAWASAEPGVVFMERYNKWHSNYYFNRINCVNPCVTGDTLVTTQDGLVEAKNLKVGQKILTPKGFKPIKKFYNNGKQRIYRVRFSDKGELKATADHKVKALTASGVQEWVKIANLKKKDRVLKLMFLPTILGASDQGRQSNKDNYNKNQQDYNHQQQVSIQRGDVHNYNLAFLAQTKLKSQQRQLIMLQNITAFQSTLSTGVIKGGNTAIANTTWPISAVMSESFLSSERVKTNLSKKSVDRLATNSIIQSNLVEVVEVEDTGRYEDVFDVYEPDTLTWITNGYVSLDCGEEGLPAYGVCNLGSLNLAAFVNKEGKMDYKSLYEHAKIGTRFQDNIIDGDIYIFEGIRKTQLEGERRIGLGTMGLGDALIKMKIRYGSADSLKVIDKIYKLIRDAAFEASTDLAREKGVFPKFDKQKYLKAYFIKKLPQKIRNNIAKYGIRNSVLLMQAPTGSTSLMAGVSSGIEPVYEFTFIRRDRLGEHKLYHPLFDVWKKKHPNQKIPDYFVSSSDLTPEDHVLVQAAIQKYVDASISKTVNAPKVFTVEDVKKLYAQAYKLGCKGITFMRDGSRPGVLEKEVKKPEVTTTNGEVKVDGIKIPVKKPRPMVVHGSTYQVESPVGITYITINSDYDNQPFEVFITVGKAGSDVGAMADAIGRLISLNLRIISPLTPVERLKKVADQMIGIGGARSVGFGEKRVRSLPDAIAKVIAMHSGFKYKNGNGEVKPIVTASLQNSLPYQAREFDPDLIGVDLFSECGLASLVFEEGCTNCYSCGYSEC